MHWEPFPFLRKFQTTFIRTAEALNPLWSRMCEFRVFLDGEEVFEDVVYAKAHDGKVMLRNILGESKEVANCRVVEVDVNSERLLLSRSVRKTQKR